jgi:hypothetical protein
MRKKGMMLALAVVLGAPAMTAGTAGTAQAQIDVRVHVPLPSIRFEVAPPLVVVSEGLQVVPDYPEEVFYVDRWYWHRAGGRWYRTRDHRGGWVMIDRRQVPVMLVGIPAGKYKHHKLHKHNKPHKHAVRHHAGKGHGHGHGKHKGKWK